MKFILIFVQIFLLILPSFGYVINYNPYDCGSNEFYCPILYDILIKRGTIIDPEDGRVFISDVGIKDGKIVDIRPNLSNRQGVETIDAAGYYVTPGLIDMHTHVFWGSTYWGIEPDPIASSSGVTTFVDAGTAGAYNFPRFRRDVIEKSHARIFSFMHMSGIGLTGRSFESSVEDFLDIEMANETIRMNKDVIKGIKVRLDAESSHSTDLLSLQRARAVANYHNIPIMVHTSFMPPNLTEIIAYLREGDILTHAFHGHENRLVDSNGNPLPVVNQIRQKGILLDIGHGSGSFSYHTTEGLLRNGIKPDIISSDVHQASRLGPMFDLPTVMSKFLNLGMELKEIIYATTLAPAKILKESGLGTIRIGSPADITILGLAEGNFTFKDSHQIEKNGALKLYNYKTISRGIVMKNEIEKSPHPWVYRDFNTKTSGHLDP